MNTGLHGTNGLNAETSNGIYRAYVLQRLLHRLQELSLTKGHNSSMMYRLFVIYNRFHNVQLQWQCIYMLPCTLPLDAELHKRQMSLLHSVLVSDKESECLKGNLLIHPTT